MSAPGTDVYDADHEYHVILDLPGVPEDRLQVDVGPVPGTLSVRAEPASAAEPQGQPLRIERAAHGAKGPLQRIVPVAWDADVDAAEYDLRDGVLHVTVPKRKPDSAASKGATSRKKK